MTDVLKTDVLKNVLLERSTEAYPGPNGPHTRFTDNRSDSGRLAE